MLHLCMCVIFRLPSSTLEKLKSQIGHRCAVLIYSTKNWFDNYLYIFYLYFTEDEQMLEK